MNNHYDIIIVGAGMVGASAALALAKHGHRIAIIENNSEQTFDIKQDHDLRVSAISPSSEKLLSNLGIWPLIKAQRSCAYHKMTVWDENSAGELHFDAANQAHSHLGHIIENKLITYALHQQLKHHDLITVYWQDSVQKIDEDLNLVHTVLTSKNTLTAKLFIAADGKFSSSRDLLNIPVISHSYQQKAIVANVTTELPHQHTAWQRFLSTGPLAFLPLSNGQSSIVWSCDNDLADHLMALTDAEFCSQLNQAFELKLGTNNNVSQRASFPLSWQYADQTVKNRCVLIGDAAHSIHPLAGQGVNLGFSDVQLISNLLHKNSLEKPKKCLRRFERQRKHDTAISLHSMTGINATFSNHSRLSQQIRGWGMNAINSQLSLKRSIIQRAQ